MRLRIRATVVMAAAALALPAAAQAATKTVQAGPFGAKAAKFQAVAGDSNEFFRRVVTIHKGDKVRWKLNGFHNVLFSPAGEPAPAFIVPDPSTPVAGVNDAAGNPFWFNGQPSLRPNLDVVAPQGGKTFDPSELVNSGLPAEDGPPPPYVLRFNRKGSFSYLCSVHPGMNGKVRVLGSKRSIPSARKDRRAARRQLQASLERVQRLASGIGTGDLSKAILAGNDRRSGPTVFAYFPAASSFRVGETVELKMPASTTESHTFTFGPTNGKDLYNDQLAASFLGEVIDPRGAYPSEPPPAGVPIVTPLSHGNGFYNSGLLDGDASSPLPASTTVKFGAPGTYQLICLIHPFMTGTVTVTP